MTRTHKRAGIYLRVSTRDQSTGSQRAQLSMIAIHAGWRIVEVYRDAGVSGAKGRDQRPGFDQMLKDATRRHFDLLMAWSVDRPRPRPPTFVPTLPNLQ